MRTATHKGLHCSYRTSISGVTCTGFKEGGNIGNEGGAFAFHKQEGFLQYAMIYFPHDLGQRAHGNVHFTFCDGQERFLLAFVSCHHFGLELQSLQNGQHGEIVTFQRVHDAVGQVPGPGDIVKRTEFSGGYQNPWFLIGAST